MSYMGLYPEDSSLFFAELFISAIVTIFIYGAFPLIFAKTTKKPITKKKYKWRCYGLNIIGMVCFAALKGSASGGPYLLWTWMFSNYGAKTLSARGLLKDGEQPDGLNNDGLNNNSCKSIEESTGELQESPDLEIVQTLPQEVAEHPAEEETEEESTYKNNQLEPIKPEVEYCIQCGARVDPVTKEYIGDGKQRFKGFKGAKVSIIVIFLVLAAVVSAFCAVQYKREIINLEGQVKTKQEAIAVLEEQVNTQQKTIDGLEKKVKGNTKTIDNLERRIKEKTETVASLQDQLSDSRKLENFVNTYVVFIEDNGTNYYHKYKCYQFRGNRFWVFNTEAAVQRGYRACPYCC